MDKYICAECGYYLEKDLKYGSLVQKKDGVIPLHDKCKYKHFQKLFKTKDNDNEL